MPLQARAVYVRGVQRLTPQGEISLACTGSRVFKLSAFVLSGVLSLDHLICVCRNIWKSRLLRSGDSCQRHLQICNWTASRFWVRESALDRTSCEVCTDSLRQQTSKLSTCRFVHFRYAESARQALQAGGCNGPGGLSVVIRQAFPRHQQDSQYGNRTESSCLSLAIETPDRYADLVSCQPHAVLLTSNCDHVAHQACQIQLPYPFGFLNVPVMRSATLSVPNTGFPIAGAISRWTCMLQSKTSH